MAREMRTSKKVKVRGTETYVNALTGEEKEMVVTEIEERDFNFTKVWMRSFLTTLDIVGNQKTKVAFWIIEHLDKENKLCYTQRQMADETGASIQTVNFTIKALMDADFLRKVNQCVYIVNPDIIFKGTRNARLSILNDYSNAERIPLSDSEKLSNLRNAVAKLQESISQLEQKMTKTEELSA